MRAGAMPAGQCMLHSLQASVPRCRRCAAYHAASLSTCLPLLFFVRRLPTAVPGRSRRYHYNVSNHRLDVHVTKGFDDGLFISSVCACGDLWAIIMDAGTGFTQQVGNWVRCVGGCAPVLPCAAQAFRSALHGAGVLLGAARCLSLSLPAPLLCSCPAPTAACASACVGQVYRVAQRSFLPKDWIMEQWDKGFYITGGRGVVAICHYARDSMLRLTEAGQVCGLRGQQRDKQPWRGTQRVVAWPTFAAPPFTPPHLFALPQPSRAAPT